MARTPLRGAIAAAVTATVVGAGLVGVASAGAAPPPPPSASVAKASPRTDVPGARVFTQGAVPPRSSSGVATGNATYKDINGEYVNTQRYYSDYSGTGVEFYTAHYTGYFGADDASWPRIGDTFYVHMTSGNVSPRIGAAPIMGLVFDNAFINDVLLAVSGTTPVTCWFNDGSTTTRDNANCLQTPEAAVGGGLYFGGRPLASGQSFDVRVPVVVTKPKSGIGSGAAALFAQRTTVGVGATPDPIVARQWMFVADRTPEFYGLYASGIGNGQATTNGIVYPFWKSGTIYFDRGPSANNYTVTSAPDPFDSSSPGWQANATWTGLSPSTTYHWRMRVVLSTGQTYASPDQAFTTPSSGVTSQPSPTTGVTASTAPPGSTIAPAPVVTAPSVTTSSSAPPPTSSPPVVTAPARAATTVKGWPARPLLARAGRTAVKSVTLSVTATPARGRVGVVQAQSCRKVGTRAVCTWVKVRTVRWPTTASGRAAVVLTAVKGRAVTYRLVLPQTATAKAFVSRALVVRGA